MDVRLQRSHFKVICLPFDNKVLYLVNSFHNNLYHLKWRKNTFFFQEPFCREKKEKKMLVGYIILRDA